MKHALLTTIALLVYTSISAQNLQLHYDTRGWIEGDNPSGNIMTTTFEFLKDDKWGSTFMFVDLDIHFNSNTLGLAYLEIARDQYIKGFPLAAHIEYNGGMMKGVSIPHAYLAGLSHILPVGKFFFKSYVAYRLNQYDHVSHDGQLALVWGGKLFDDRIGIEGFFYIWSSNKDRSKGVGGKRLIFLSEPQIWYYAIKDTFAVGTEVEVSNNLYGTELKCYPTLAVKYIF